MRVCLITSAPLPPREGVGFHVWNLAQQLAARGHQVGIITRGRAARTAAAQFSGIVVWQPPFVPAYPFHVHLHGLFVDSLLRQVGDGFDMINAHTPLPPAVTSSLPLVTTVHTPMLADTAATAGRSLYAVAVRLQTPISRRIEMDLFGRSQKVTAVAGWVARSLGAYGVDPAAVGITGNAVEPCFLRETPALRRDPVILYVGRLAPGKGLEDLVEAAKIVVRRSAPRNVRFVLAGDGNLMPALRRLICDAGLEHSVKLLGHVGCRDEMARMYHSAMLFVLPSHHEGMPTVLLEAMASGLPAVSTAVGGALEVVTSGRDGLLVPPRDPQTLADALLCLLGQPDLRAYLGAQARKVVQKHYTWDAVTQRYLACYQQAMASSG